MQHRDASRSVGMDQGAQRGERRSRASRKRSLKPLNTMPLPDQNEPPKAELARLGTSDLLAVLQDAQAADLTAEKSAVVMKRDGYNITGFVLCHPVTGNRCIVEMSACRWLTKDESWWLMHISESPLAANNPPNNIP